MRFPRTLACQPLALRSRSRASDDRRQNGPVVLVGAGLLVRTLQNLRNVDPGFDTRNLLTFRLDPTLIGYKTPQVDAFYRDLQQRIAAIPGVESVSYSNSTLLSGSLWGTGFHLEGTPKDQQSDADYLPIGEGFFSMMHMRLLSGRNFNSADFAQAEAAGGKGNSASRAWRKRRMLDFRLRAGAQRSRRARQRKRPCR